MLRLREQIKRAFPLLDVAIELTNHCQLKCKMCWSQNPKLNPPRPKGFMSFKLFKQVIDELKAYWGAMPVYQAPHKTRSPFTIAFSYLGESFLHPQFKQFVKYLVDSELWCNKVVYTNGLLLDKYVDLLIDHFYRVNLSIHNPLNQKVDDNIKLLLKKRGNQKNHPSIFINLVREEFSATTIIEKKLEYAPLVNYFTIKGTMTEDLKYSDGYRRPQKCQSPFFYLTVLWNGDTLPCCKLLSSGSFSMGNIRDGLEKVWFGKKFEDLRNHRIVGYPCEHCRLYQGLASPNFLTYVIFEGLPEPRLC